MKSLQSCGCCKYLFRMWFEQPCSECNPGSEKWKFSFINWLKLKFSR